MQPLLLLHGAIGAADQLEPLATELDGKYDVNTLDFSGHGNRPFPDEEFSIRLFAADVLAYMQEKGLDKVSIFGYSMGGYVAMYLAKHYPDKIEKIVTLATKFRWTPEIAEKETAMLNADKIAAKVPAFADALHKRHSGKDWKEVLAKTAIMLQNLGADNALKPHDYKDIQTPCLVLLGDRDKMVGLDETLEVYRSLPNASLGMLPGTPHPIEHVDTTLLSFLATNFFK